MATKFASIQISNATDALFQAWTQYIDDLLVITGGWTHTADTGQVDLTTVAHPTTATTVGYKIYAMGDALQATAPVFMRIDYGAITSASNACIKVTIGTSTDGAGNITGTTLSQFTVSAQNVGTAAVHCYGSADTSRMVFMFPVTTGSQMIFSIERTKDSTGADTSDGLLLTYCNGSSSGTLNVSQYFNLTGGSPNAETGVTFTLSNQATSAFSSDVGIGLILHFKGTVVQPGLNVAAVNSGDFAIEAQFTMTVYGAAHTYQVSANTGGTLINIPTGNGASTGRGSTRVCIRYE